MVKTIFLIITSTIVLCSNIVTYASEINEKEIDTLTEKVSNIINITEKLEEIYSENNEELYIFNLELEEPEVLDIAIEYYENKIQKTNGYIEKLIKEENEIIEEYNTILVKIFSNDEESEKYSNEFTEIFVEDRIGRYRLKALIEAEDYKMACEDIVEFLDLEGEVITAEDFTNNVVDLGIKYFINANSNRLYGRYTTIDYTEAFRNSNEVRFGFDVLHTMKYFIVFDHEEKISKALNEKIDIFIKALEAESHKSDIDFLNDNEYIIKSSFDYFNHFDHDLEFIYDYNNVEIHNINLKQFFHCMEILESIDYNYKYLRILYNYDDNNEKYFESLMHFLIFNDIRDQYYGYYEEEGEDTYTEEAILRNIATIKYCYPDFYKEFQIYLNNVEEFVYKYCELEKIYINKQDYTSYIYSNNRFELVEEFLEELEKNKTKMDTLEVVPSYLTWYYREYINYIGNNLEELVNSDFKKQLTYEQTQRLESIEEEFKKFEEYEYEKEISLYDLENTILFDEEYVDTYLNIGQKSERILCNIYNDVLYINDSELRTFAEYSYEFYNHKKNILYLSNESNRVPKEVDERNDGAIYINNVKSTISGFEIYNGDIYIKLDEFIEELGYKIQNVNEEFGEFENKVLNVKLEKK